MSIRLLLDGHNFSQASRIVAKYKSGNDGQIPPVSFDTAKTILLPEYLCEKGVEEDYLRLNGMGLTGAETAVTSECRDGMVAVMGIDASVAELAREEFGDGVRFTSPLLEIASGRKRDINIFLTVENVYLVVWEKGLRMAEVFPENTPESLLYYMQSLGHRFRLKKFDINIGGHEAEDAARGLAQYFKHVKTVEL